jgi:hypothetical protein
MSVATVLRNVLPVTQTNWEPRACRQVRLKLCGEFEFEVGGALAALGVGEVVDVAGAGQVQGAGKVETGRISACQE